MTRDALGEAADLAGLPRDEVRVLEPSPPANAAEPWLADDPVTPGGALSPFGSGGRGWDDWASAHPEQRGWAADRWLLGDRTLPAVPDLAALTATRLGLHRLAVYVVSPARRRVNGKLGLRWTLGGFGTPFFGADEQIRIAGTDLIRESRDGSGTVPISSLAAAAEFALGGPPDLAWAEGFDIPPAGDLEEPLALDPSAAGWLGEWFGFGNRVLERLRTERGADTRVQLWPEHFDLAVTLPVAGAPATFGVSPGDGGRAEPYLYVLPGRGVEAGDLWNATGFTGAILGVSELVGPPAVAAGRFFATRVAELER